jgi:hypothetical protein
MLPAASWPIPCKEALASRNVENGAGAEATAGLAIRNNAVATNATRAEAMRHGREQQGSGKGLVFITGGFAPRLLTGNRSTISSRGTYA